MFRWLTSVAISTLAVPICIFRVVTSPRSRSPFTDDEKTTVIAHDRQFGTHTLTEIDTTTISAATVGCDNKETRDFKCGAIQPGNYINLKNGPCHYMLQGPDDGKLVIMLHGISVYSFIWMKLAKELNKNGYRVLTFDFYGHGFSAAPNVDYNSSLYIDQLEELIARLGLKDQHDSAVVIGHSMGGLISTEFTARHPTWVERVVLFNAAGLPVKICVQNTLPFTLWQLIRVIRSTTLFDFVAPTLAKILSLSASTTAVTYESIIDSAHRLDEELEAEETWLRNVLKSITQRVVDEGTLRFAKAITFLYKCWMHQIVINADRAHVLLSVIRNFPLLDANHSETLKKIQDQIPVLIIWGKDDGILPCHLLNDFAAHLPHAELLNIPNSDHAAFLQKHGLVFSKIMNFMTKTVKIEESGVQTQ